MKLLKYYKENELVKLSAEEKQQLFLLECADRGVTLPSATPQFIRKPEMEDRFKPDATIFIVKRGWNDICFAKDRDGADEIVKALIVSAVRADYHYVNSEKVYCIEDTSDNGGFEVSEVAAYSSNLYNELKNDIEEYEKNADSIEKSNSRREKIIDAQDAVLADVNDAIDKATRNTTEVAALAKLFSEYTKMANGDREVAIRFFLSSSHDRVAEFANEPERMESIGITKEELTTFEANSQPGDSDDE